MLNVSREPRRSGAREIAGAESALTGRSAARSAQDEQHPSGLAGLPRTRPARQRKAVVLRVPEGMTTLRAATILRRRQGPVAAHLQVAAMSLSRRLQPERDPRPQGAVCSSEKTKVLSSRYVAVAAAASLDMLALWSAAAGAMDEASEDQQFIRLMDGYPGVSRRSVEWAGRREGIVEIYEDRGELRAAIPHPEGILRDHGNDNAVRAIVSSRLRDVYRKTGQDERALELLDDVIARAAR